MRSVTRDVIFLPEKYKTIPTKSVKESLSKRGRVKSVGFRRTMTPQQLKATITRGFSSIECRNFGLLATRDNKLTESVDLSGEDICAKRGAIIYVYQEVC